MARETRIQYNTQYHERDPQRKTINWATDVIAALRAEWTPIVDGLETKKNREILHAKQSLEDIKRAFRKGESFVSDHKWVSIAVMQRIRNILVAEFIKGSYSPNVESIDVAATSEKKRDRALLQARALIEGPMTDIGRRIGNDRPYKIDKKQFSGNVDKFDELGLDSSNPTHVNFFMERFHRLWHEVSAQELVKALIRYNKFSGKVEELVNDILAAGCIAYEVYASPFSGEIKWAHLQPESVKSIWGENRDGADASCIGYEKNVSVRRFLEIAGPAFDINRDAEHLRNAVNFYNGRNFVRVSSQGCWDVDNEGQHILVHSYSELLTFTVGLGKIEWKSTDAQARMKHNKTGLVYDIDYSATEEELKDKFTNQYTREEEEYQRTYRAWYLGKGSGDQFVFRFGPLYHQLSYGTADEYSAYSIHAFRSTGQTAVEIAEPWIKIGNTAFHKIAWGLDESLPTIENINYEAVARLITKLTPEGAGATQGSELPEAAIAGQVEAVINKYLGSLRRVYSSTDENGDQMGGDGRPHYRDEGKVDPLAVGMMEVLDWAESQVSLRLGINPLRLAETPDPKDGYKSGQQQLKSSQNATYYIPMMMQDCIRDVAETSLMIAQDAIEVKKTRVYDFLERLIGTEALVPFKDLEKIPGHRYAIFVEIFNAEEKRQEMKIEAQMAFERGQITYDQYLIVKEIDDAKKAGVTLAFFRTEQERQKQQEAALLHQRALQLQQQKADLEARNIQLEGEIKLKIEDMKGQYMVASYNDAAAADQAKKMIDVDNNNRKMQERADADIKVVEAKENAKKQAPLPISAVEPTDQPPADAPPQPA